MKHEAPATTRREFLKHTGRIAAVSALAGMAVPHVHAAENNTIQVALIGCGGRGTGAAADALAVKNGPIKLVAMADALRREAQERLRVPEEESEGKLRQQGRRAAGSPILRLRRLPEGDGLPEAGRHRDLRHAAGVPLGAFRLCHPEGAERLHGKAADGRWPDVPQDAQARRRGDGEEPQGGRGIDVPSQPRARATGPAHPATARSATSC